MKQLVIQLMRVCENDNFIICTKTLIIARASFSKDYLTPWFETEKKLISDFGEKNMMSMASQLQTWQIYLLASAKPIACTRVITCYVHIITGKENDSLNSSFNSSNSPLPHPSHIPYNPQKHVNSKPPYSFSCLIFMAIEESTEKKLPVKVSGWSLYCCDADHTTYMEQISFSCTMVCHVMVIIRWMTVC